MTRRISRILALTAVVSAVAAVRASGPDIEIVQTVQSFGPAARADYARGQLGVVRPTFARRHLVQAYRVLHGAPPAPALTFEAWELRPPQDVAAARQSPTDVWEAARRAAVGQEPLFLNQFRQTGDYQYFGNCLDDALTSAARTLTDRVRRYGAGQPVITDWVRAQDVVFSNCGGTDLQMPDPAPTSADALIRADRAYQRAAALFYATRYDEAARAFTAIANDAASPWQPYGRYLTARAFIRQALVTDTEDATRTRRFAAAEVELRAVLALPGASALHASARGLLNLIAVRSRPVDRLHALARVLASSPTVTDAHVADFEYLMDRMIGDTVDYDYAQIRNGDALVDDPMLDWIAALQAHGDDALARSLRRWEETGSPAWLIAVLWKLPPAHPMVDTALKAPIVDVGSPAFSTLTFLRVRLLIERGNTAEARRLLASLPDRASRGADVETINLYRAARMRLARSLREFLATAPRIGLNERPLPVFDADATHVLSNVLPLDRLVDAAESPALPGRLRVRVATAAFTRAVRLNRDETAQRAAAVLRELAPHLRGDLDRYRAAGSATERHTSAVRLLLRTPGASDVVAVDDSTNTNLLEPARRVQTFGTRWWCKSAYERQPGEGSTMFPMLYRDGARPPTPFVSAADRQQRAQEARALEKTEAVFAYLTAETLAWVKANPDDPDAPEALAQAIHGVRSSCGADPILSRQAFRLLHERYAGTAAARRTRYWYTH